MPAHSQRTDEIVIARSKRTGERYPIRTSNLAGHRGSRGSYPHYTDSTRLHVCRCSAAHEHEKPRSVSEYDRNLAISITRYMDRFRLDKCHLPEFLRYREQQKVQWALYSVHAERFHYISKDKSVVCRCSNSGHRFYRRVHNPEIQELCAEFFLSETMQTLCTRDQWRVIDEITATGSTSSVKARVDSPQPRSRELTPSKSSFEYDNTSVVELLQVCETRSPRSGVLHSRSSSHQRARPPSLDEGDIAHLSNGAKGELDIPGDLWRVSRPSVYLGQDNSESHLSTPIGSSATPVQPHRDILPKVQMFRPESLELGATAPGVDQYAEVWSEVASHPKVAELDNKFNSQSLYKSPPSRSTHRFGISELDDAGPDVRFSGNSRATTPIAELPSLEKAIELDAALIQRPYLTHHSATLRELEGCSFVHIAGLTG